MPPGLSPGKEHECPGKIKVKITGLVQGASTLTYQLTKVFVCLPSLIGEVVHQNILLKVRWEVLLTDSNTLVIPVTCMYVVAGGLLVKALDCGSKSPGFQSHLQQRLISLPGALSFTSKIEYKFFLWFLWREIKPSLPGNPLILA